MNNNELQIESLKNFILKVAGKQLNKTITNEVVEGIVIKVNENNSTYEVQPKNSNAAAAITATSLNDTIYQVNDLVYMISYEGDLSTVYHIFGSVKSVAEDFINLSFEDRFEAEGYTPINIKEASLDYIFGSVNASKLNYTLNADGVSYSVDNGADWQAIEEDIIIPSTYNNLPVTGIINYSFYDVGTLNSIYIPKSIETITNQTFFSCGPNFKIYCERKESEKPDTWESSWNPQNYPIIWEVKSEYKAIDTIKQEGCFKIEGKFTTEEDINQKEDFGIKIELLSNNVYVQENIINTYYLNPPYFLGQPYNLDGSISQSRIISLSESEREKFNCIRISSYGTNFEYSNIKLSCGTLLNIEGTLNVLTTIENNKDYVSSRNLNDKAVVSVKVNYDGQELNSTLLSYYWLLKDENVKDEDDKGYFAAAGAGWRCLNSFEEVSILGVKDSLRHWDDESRTFELFPNGTEEEDVQLPHYENTLKCLVQFKDLTVESREFTIYNYDKEQFSATLVSNVEPASIISKKDFITLTCNLKNENKKWNESDSSYEYIYTWLKDDGSKDGANITPKEADGTLINKNTLTIYGAEQEGTEADHYIMASEKEKIYCKVKITRNGEIISLDGEKTNTIDIISYIGLEATIKKETFYKYYISTNMNVIFAQADSNEEGEGSETEWNGDWIIDDSSVVEGEDPSWKDQKEDEQKQKLKGNDGYNVVFKDTSIVNSFLNTSDDLYVYYTQKDVWTQEKMGGSELIREENWATPLIARGLDYDANQGGWYNSKEGAAAEKINTFNKLTNNGTLEGIHFDGNEAYINATYINTGTLRVGDENEELFYADIETGDSVKIAGFYVDKNSIHSNNGSINISSDNSDNNNLAIAVGEWLKFIIQNASELQLFYKIDESGNDSVYGKEEADNNILNIGFQDNIPIITFTYDNPDSPQDKNVDTYIYNGKYEYESTIYDRWDGIGQQEGRFILTNIIVEKSSKFSVNHAGQLKAEDADIEGKIIAKEGEIGGFEITKNSIQSKNQTFILSNSVEDTNNNGAAILAGRNDLDFIWKDEDIIPEGSDITNYGAYYIIVNNEEENIQTFSNLQANYTVKLERYMDDIGLRLNNKESNSYIGASLYGNPIIFSYNGVLYTRWNREDESQILLPNAILMTQDIGFISYPFQLNHNGEMTVVTTDYKEEEKYFSFINEVDKSWRNVEYYLKTFGNLGITSLHTNYYLPILNFGTPNKWIHDNIENKYIGYFCVVGAKNSTLPVKTNSLVTEGNQFVNCNCSNATIKLYYSSGLTQEEISVDSASLFIIRHKEDPNQSLICIKVKVKSISSSEVLQDYAISSYLTSADFTSILAKTSALIPISGSKLVLKSEDSCLVSPSISINPEKVQIRAGELQLTNFKDINSYYSFALTDKGLQCYCSYLVGEGENITFHNEIGTIGWEEAPGENTSFRITGLFTDAIYPIGSIYMSTKSTTPMELFGGTWERIEDVFLLGANDTNIEATGDGKMVRANLPDDLKGKIYINSSGGNYGLVASETNTAIGAEGGNNIFTAEGQTKNAAYATTTYSGETKGYSQIGFDFKGTGEPYYPPYLAVYIWQRIA